ncbi:hypothetical protein [Sorangium sp. So ce854]|uniref:hypothetical protein n=1 Tax=Sorangium sp. So ce854 TaxID=3133322 RepID=UPI003F622D71
MPRAACVSSRRASERAGRERRAGRRGAIGALLALACAGAAASPARAEAPATPAPAEAPPRPEDARAAARAFEEGERAFRAGDFACAAAAFEAAYRAAPHASPLWNAARSWHRAGEAVRAANLYARYLREAPPDAPDRDAAGAALGQLAPRLGRIDVYAPGARDVRVDDVRVEGASVYVNPGSHVVAGEIDAQALRRTEVVGAGEVRSVALVAAAPRELPPAPAAPPPPPPAAGAPAARTSPAPSPARRPLPPAGVIVGAAVTAIGAGLTVASGLDTLAARDTFDAAPTEENLAVGLGKQRRTNVLLGATIGLGALTGAAAIWLVDWGAPAAAPSPAQHAVSPARHALALSIGPARITVGGVF